MNEKRFFRCRVVQTRFEATDVLSFWLRRTDDALLPSGAAGAHVDVKLGDGLLRSYSLSARAEEPDVYRITVAREPNGRGGSAHLHDVVRAGQLLEVSEPTSNFPLDEGAHDNLLIAGGIGITPFLPMVGRLNELGRKWRLHYCVRTRDRAVFVAELEAAARAGQGDVRTYFDREPGGARLDLARVLSDCPPGAHVYCCGPPGMLASFREIAASRFAPDEVHVEYFSSTDAPATDGGFVVELARSKKTLTVLPGKTILETVVASGVDVPFSCQEGVCGSCETRLLEGVADHRDKILSVRERADGKTIMICCSGARSDRLVLDL